MIDFNTDHPPVTTEERMKALRGLSRIERELGYVDESVAEADLRRTSRGKAMRPKCPTRWT